MPAPPPPCHPRRACSFSSRSPFLSTWHGAERKGFGVSSADQYAVSFSRRSSGNKTLEFTRKRIVTISSGEMFIAALLTTDSFKPSFLMFIRIFLPMYWGFSSRALKYIRFSASSLDRKALFMTGSLQEAGERTCRFKFLFQPLGDAGFAEVASTD